MTTPTEPIAAERCRPFSIGDAMIFVAAAAVGMTLVQGSGMVPILWSNLRALPFGRPSDWSVWRVWLTQTNPSNWTTGVVTIVVLANNVMVAFLLPLTVASMIVRLRRPRPALGRVWWQPGMLAGEALALTFVLTTGVEMAQPPGFGTVWVVLILMPLPMAWVVLALSGRWRREPGWIDRLGVGIGACWCLEILAYLWFALRLLK